MSIYAATTAETVEMAKIAAEAHMLAQIISRQYDYCQFQYTNDGSFICDGQEMTLGSLLSQAVVAWFVEFVPTESVLALAAVATTFVTDVDSPSGVDDINMEFIKKLHELLMYKWHAVHGDADFMSCLCEDPDTMIP